jgi:PrtD family type I secretion system ABC transporter
MTVPMRQPIQFHAKDPVAMVLRQNRSTVIGVAVFSAIINVLMLTSPIFMMQVYDRVLSSRSLPTLVALLVLGAILLLLMAMLDFLRASILSRIGIRIDAALRDAVFVAVVDRQLRRDAQGDGQQIVRDLDLVRGFLSGPGLIALFDLPWMPFYLILCFAFHPLLGYLALGGALALIVLMYWGYRVSIHAALRSTEALSRRNGWMEESRRNAESLRALGMVSNIRNHWRDAHVTGLVEQAAGAEAGSAISAFTKMFRMLLQMLLLAAGAYLVIQNLATPGVMLAASLIAGRALAPLEQAIGQWRQFLQYREARGRLAKLEIAEEGARTSLPPPNRSLLIKDVAIAPPGSRNVTLQGVTLGLEAGMAIAVVGPSAAGKSTLARGLIGAWPIVRGEIRFDGAAFDQWSREDLGRVIGYLPQSVDLFDGTVAQNIARFSPVQDDAAIIAAAKTAGAHEMILKLPQGYDTRVGESHVALSAGQKQRIGLARAIYADPFLVVLDEPNSNLDAEGEGALARAIRAIRERGGIVLVMAHRPSALAEASHVLFIRDGRQVVFGPRDDVMRKIVSNPEVVGKSGGITSNGATPAEAGQ